jgi:uncharacterized membrane protein
MKRPAITGMGLLIVAGVLIVALGAFVVFGGSRVASEGTVKVGPFKSKVHAQSTVPPLFGWVAIVAGVLLVFAGSVKKR